MGSYTSARVFRVVFFVCVSFGLFLQAQATHIKAGDIKAERISATSLSYRFTLNLYTRPASETGIPSDQATLNFGDGKSVTVNKAQTITFDGSTENNVFIFLHTYSGPGFYPVGYQEVNRIASIINMSNSVGTPFYIEMALSISPTSGINSSPVLSVPPLDKGVIGQIYTHNPGAYDPDGDSLSFSLVIPQSDKGVQVGNYNYPDQFGGTSTTGGAPFITINPVSGNIVWNAPSDRTNSGSLPRYYNIAIRVNEYRSGVMIGYVIRDMQIEIDDIALKPPVLKMPSDTCIVAGTWLKDTITASHPQNFNISLETYGGIYVLPTSPAVFPPVTINNNTSHPSITLDWKTTCAHIREQPYDVVYKAKNMSGTPTLTDVRSFLIYVKAPKPQNLAVTPLGNSIKLTWKSYKTGTCSNVDKIKIYRKECSAANVNPEPCDDGIPLGVGYVLIKTVDGKDSVFTDNNNGVGLTPGVGYCYAIIATFPSPGKGISYPSDEACGNIAIEVPMEAVVSVTSTSITTGSIQLNWFKPLDNVTAPFTYEAWRASSDAPTVYSLVATIPIDTFYTDVNLDTKEKQYFYKIKLVSTGNFSPVQSSILLTTAPRNASALVSWKVTSAFGLDTMEVYRSINGGAFSIVKILMNPSKTGNYTDAAVPIANCDSVRYYLKVKGHYCDPKLPGEVISDSPIQVVVPMDDTPPPAPVLTLKSCAAPYNLHVNDLTWTDVRPPVCNTIKGYNVYYAPHSGQGLSLLAFLTDTNYVHNIIDSSLAGCYEVRSINYQDIESVGSNRICVDNCVYYQLPNLVTRDNNGRNDIFQAFPIPLGVHVVRFTVFNRWGNQVYSFEGDPNINWRTIDGAQNFLTEGVYYYEAEVHYYRRLNPDDETEILKGWVHLLGDKEPPKK
ncbi:MAG: hypothetical protein JWM14_2542 [Chitinophagaceae bacterium]|nr:hypothetical protein [Chitinophagaceae bacterium]